MTNGIPLFAMTETVRSETRPHGNDAGCKTILHAKRKLEGTAVLLIGMENGVEMLFLRLLLDAKLDVCEEALFVMGDRRHDNAQVPGGRTLVHARLLVTIPHFLCGCGQSRRVCPC